MAVFNSSLNMPISDRESSDSSSEGEPSSEQSDSPTCIYCKSRNNNHPLCGYCENCLQICRRCKVQKTFKYFMFCVSCNIRRKNFCPPRPKRLKKSRNIDKENSNMPVRLGTHRGSSSLVCSPLNLEQIRVPHSVEESRTTGQDVKRSKTDCNSQHGLKRHLSDSSLPDFDVKRPSSSKSTVEALPTEMSCLSSEISSGSSIIELLSTQLDDSELCIICNEAPKNGIFLHKKIAHQCCCYSCAIRTWRVNKRCPICNGIIYKVLKLSKF